MPALEVRREANGDLMVMEYDLERDMFQCHAIVEVPKKVLGLTSYLWNESWESEAVWLDKSDSATALRAFCDARIEDLRAMWERA